MPGLRFPDFPSARVCPPLGWAEFECRMFTDPVWYPRAGMNDSDVAKFTDVDWTKYASFRVDGGGRSPHLDPSWFFQAHVGARDGVFPVCLRVLKRLWVCVVSCLAGMPVYTIPGYPGTKVYTRLKMVIHGGVCYIHPFWLPPWYDHGRVQACLEDVDWTGQVVFRTALTLLLVETSVGTFSLVSNPDSLVN